MNTIALMAQRLKATVPIGSVIGHYVKLTPKGNRWEGLCPFHDDHHPSLVVSPEKGTWRCFACGKGGDMFDFVMEYEHVSFPEAVRRVAAIVGMPMSEERRADGKRADDGERERLRAGNQRVAEACVAALAAEGCPGRDFLARRGVTAAAIDRYRLGYSVATHRVTFPWQDATGQVVGFGARLLDGRTHGVKAKYLNSKDSALFHKGNELYGLYQALPEMRTSGRAYVVEGYIDVIAMAQAGVGNTVATCGTALTEAQASLLRRYADTVVVVYDGDRAGEEATKRAGETLLRAGLRVWVVRLPGEEDPDSYAMAHGGQALRDYLESHAQAWTNYRGREVLAMEDEAARSVALGEIGRLLATSPEAALMRLVVEYGEREITVPTDGRTAMRVARYVHGNLWIDGLRPVDPIYGRILREAGERCDDEGFTARDFFGSHDDPEVATAARLLMAVPHPEPEDLAAVVARRLGDFRTAYLEEQRARMVHDQFRPRADGQEEDEEARALRKWRENYMLLRFYHRQKAVL